MYSSLRVLIATMLAFTLVIPATMASAVPIRPHPAQSAPPMVYASSNQGAVDLLKSEVRAMISTGLQNGANNFALLREQPIGNSGTVYTARPLGNYVFMLRTCFVKYFEKDGRYPAQWGYGCLSSGFTGSQGTVEAQLRDSIAADLPPGFSATPPRDTSDGDFRWWNATTGVDVTLRAIAAKGVSTFNVQMHHGLT